MILSPIFFSVLAFALGASVASFLFAWVMRLPNHQESILCPPRSFCRQCQKPLSWHELIPVFSWLLQRGRCACDKVSISSLYLGVELLLGLIFVLIARSVGDWGSILFFWLLASFLFFFFMTDWRYQLLHVPMMLGCAATGLVFQATQQQLGLALISMGLGFGLLFLINQIFFWVRKKQGLGSGDKYLLGAIGAWAMPQQVGHILIVACWLALLYAVMLWWQKRPYHKIPLGAFFCLAAPIILVL